MWDKHWVMIELCRVSGMFITLVTSRKFCWEYITSVATPHYCRISLALLVFTAKIYTLPQSQVTPLMMRNPCFGKLTNGILTHQKMLPWKWNLSLSFISQKWFFMMTWAEHNCFLSRLKCPWKFWCAIHISFGYFIYVREWQKMILCSNICVKDYQGFHCCGLFFVEIRYHHKGFSKSNWRSLKYEILVISRWCFY